jgi:hypothetical protein
MPKVGDEMNTESTLFASKAQVEEKPSLETLTKWIST